MNEQYQHKARKRFGQNFLHDAGVIDRILRAINAKAGERLLKSARARVPSPKAFSTAVASSTLWSSTRIWCRSSTVSLPA